MIKECAECGKTVFHGEYLTYEYPGKGSGNWKQDITGEFDDEDADECECCGRTFCGECIDAEFEYGECRRCRERGAAEFEKEEMERQGGTK